MIHQSEWKRIKETYSEMRVVKRDVTQMSKGIINSEEIELVKIRGRRVRKQRRRALNVFIF